MVFYHTSKKNPTVKKTISFELLNLTVVNSKFISEETLMFLDGLEYLIDKRLHNHIYDIHLILDDINASDEKPSRKVRVELRAIKKLLKERFLKIIKTII